MQVIQERIDYISSELSYYNNKVKSLNENILKYNKEIKNYTRVIKKIHKKNKNLDFFVNEKELIFIKELLLAEEVLLTQVKEKYQKNYIDSIIQEKSYLLKNLEEIKNKSRLNYNLEKENKRIFDIQSNYNSIRKSFLNEVNIAFYDFKKLLIEDFEDSSFSDRVESLLLNAPSADPVDINATIALRLVLDFFEKYLILKPIRRDSFSKNHFQRFLYVLENAEYYLNLANDRGFFYLNKVLLHTDTDTDTDTIYYDNVFLFKDITVIDDKLFDIVKLNFKTAKKSGLLEKNEILSIDKSLNHQDFKSYEQLEYFDIDEVANSIDNSMKTAQWFLNNKNFIPSDAKHDLLCCFLKKVKIIDLSSVPNQHKIYEVLDSNDKITLINLMNEIILLNNTYENIHIKIALTIGSNDQNLHNIKNKIFKFSEFIANKYFYGVFFDSYSKADQKVDRFLYFFNDYIKVVFENSIQSSFVFALVPLVIDSMAWFVLNRCSYGYTSIFNESHFTVELYSKKLSLLNVPNPQYVLQKNFSKDKITAQQLHDEYHTSFLLTNIDLRFSKNITKISSQQEFNKNLSKISSDLREMRRLLVRNFKPSDSIIELDLLLSQKENSIIGSKTGKIFALWQWETFSDALGRICIGFDKDDLVRQSSKEFRRDAQYIRILRVNNNGKISPLNAPWLTTDKMGLVDIECAVDINIYLLEKFHELFYNLYAEAAHKIKQKRLALDHNDNLPTVICNEMGDSIALNYDEIDRDNIYINMGLDILEVDRNNDISTSSTNGLSSNQSSNFNNYLIFNKSLKSTKFFKILQEKFNVKISQGKGSEVNVSRVKEGGAVYRLGHHGKVVEYHANHIRKVLKRLNISVDEWLLALNKN